MGRNKNKPGDSGHPAVEGSKGKKQPHKQQQQQPIRLVASLQKLVQLNSIQKLPNYPLSSSIGSIPYHDPEHQAPTCEEEAPTASGAFPVREYKGKLIRDVWMDTHDFINEPGGFVINLTRHGQEVSKHLRIHLGIRQAHPKKLGEGDTNELGGSLGSSMTDVLQPGTITATDDYAREIFRRIRAHPGLETVTAVLEINYRDDPYEQKIFQEASPEFLRQFIQTYPTKLTKLQVEMPGLSAVYLPEWKFLLEQQTCLQTLICNLGVVLWTFYLKGVVRNTKTLERIVLRRLQSYDTNQGKFVPLDWTLFSNCQNLTYLKITCGVRPVASNVGPSMANPPTVVFLHENINKLPTHDAFAEFHLSRIWVEPCVLRELSEARPRLQLCMSCNDLEYYDADMSADEVDKFNEFGASSSLKQMRLLSVSRFDLTAEINPEGFVVPFDNSPRRRRSSERRLGCIVLALFQSIIVALAILFIIIYFRHWRRRGDGPGGAIIRNETHSGTNESSIIPRSLTAATTPALEFITSDEQDHDHGVYK